MFTTGITRTFSSPYYSGTAATISAGQVSAFDVALNGTPYMLDLDNPDAEKYGLESIPMLHAMFLQDRGGTVPIGEHCVDEETEILTRRGWLTCDEVRVGDWAWTLRPDYMAEWQPIEDVSVWPIRQRTMLSIEGRSHSSLSTLDHRWPIRRHYQHSKVEPPVWQNRIVRSRDLNTNASLVAAAPAAHDQVAKYDDALVELVGWFWAEGSVTYQADNERPRRYEISQSRKRNMAKVDRIRSLFQRLLGDPQSAAPIGRARAADPPRTWTVYENPNGCTHFHFFPGVLPDLENAMETFRPYKAVRPEFVGTLTQAQLRLFLEGCHGGDGWWNSGGRLIAQKYPDGLHALQMATILSGQRSRLRQDVNHPRPRWLVGWHDRMTHINMSDARRVEIRHDGRVWCPRTENGTWCARRRGSVYFTGNSLTPLDYWRRSYDDFRGGTGQLYADHHDSVGNQTRASLGVDVWTEGQFSLLHDTIAKVSSVSANQYLVVAGGYLYHYDGTNLNYTASIVATTPTWTTVSATGGDVALSGVVGMVSDGYRVYVADANGVHYTTRGTATYTKYHTVAQTGITRIGFGKGRLFTSVGGSLFTHAGAAGSAVATSYFTQANPDWQWTVVGVEGNNAVYFAGYSGHVSYIYAATIKSDATALDAPVIVAQLPIGEIVRSMTSYFNVLIVGTDQGFRAAQINGQQGDLLVGSLIKLASAPMCFEKQDRFIWFGWTNYDAAHTGLGRIDVSFDNGTSNEGFVPAYASDLMAANAQGAVTSVVTFQTKRVFTVATVGLFCETQVNLVPSGFLSSGWFNYELADAKIAVKSVVQYKAGLGSFTFALAYDNQPATIYGPVVKTSAQVANSVEIPFPQVRAQLYEWTITLARAASLVEGPIVDRVTLMVEPAPERRTMWTVPLYLHHEVVNNERITFRYTPFKEREKIIALFRSRQIVPFQDIEGTWMVLIDDFKWVPENLVGTNKRWWDGTLIVKLKTIE